MARGDPIPPRVLEQAAAWLVKLHDSGVSDADRAACGRWRQSDPEHERAWQRAERLLGKLNGLPPELARAALERPAAPSRRAAIGRVAALLALAPAGWAAWRLMPESWQTWQADYHTATGERRGVRLADGSAVTLNTGSAMDVRYSAEARLIVLRAGEILVETAADAARRPLKVATAQGGLEALGTRFNVRQLDGATRIAVLEGAVRVTPSLTPSAQVLEAGWQSVLTDSDMEAPTPVDDAIAAWTQGMLLADGMRLDQLAAELSRYRSGFVQVEPSVASLRVSGAFPVADSARTLSMLAATYPLAVHNRLGGYWTTLAPR